VLPLIGSIKGWADAYHCANPESQSTILAANVAKAYWLGLLPNRAFLRAWLIGNPE
jgi:hypothetical protein